MQMPFVYGVELGDIIQNLFYNKRTHIIFLADNRVMNNIYIYIYIYIYSRVSIRVCACMCLNVCVRAPHTPYVGYCECVC